MVPRLRAFWPRPHRNASRQRSRRSRGSNVRDTGGGILAPAPFERCSRPGLRNRAAPSKRQSPDVAESLRQPSKSAICRRTNPGRGYAALPHRHKERGGTRCAGGFISADIFGLEANDGGAEERWLLGRILVVEIMELDCAGRPPYLLRSLGSKHPAPFCLSQPWPGVASP